jgi:hypothetical protein
VQVGAWYPLNWPFLLAGITPRAIGGELLLSGLVACSGAYFLARRLLRSETASILAAMCYGLSGWFAAHGQHLGMVASAAWLPWLLVGLLRYAAAPGARRLVELGLVGAAIALPGSFQIALYTFAFVAIWAGCEALVERSHLMGRRLGLGLAAAVVWGAALSAVMILPGLELVSRSIRAQVNARDLPDVGYFHASALATLVYPDYYGLLSGHYVGPGDSTQHYFYAGVLLVPLAVVGARQRRVLLTAAALGLPFVWYALGPRGGLFELAVPLPGFSSVELPMHGWFLPALGLALLGGAGMDLTVRRFGSRAGAALIGLVLLDVLVVNQVLDPLAYARASFADQYGGALATFHAQARAAEPSVLRVYGPPLAAVGYRNHALQSRVPTTYGYNPLELADYAAYTDAAAEANPRLILGLAANYQLAGDQLVRVGDALPLAYVAHPPRLVPDAAAAAGALILLDPATTTLVTGPTPEEEEASDLAATVSVVAVEEATLRLRYASATPNLLRVAIPSYPGWHATLDDRDLTLVTVDAAFTGVEVPAGEGEVLLTYTSRLFVPGALLTALALVASGLVYASWAATATRGSSTPETAAITISVARVTERRSSLAPASASAAAGSTSIRTTFSGADIPSWRSLFHLRTSSVTPSTLRPWRSAASLCQASSATGHRDRCTDEHPSSAANPCR